MLRHHADLTISIGAAVDRILDHPMDGGVGWSAPDDITIGASGRQIQTMLQEPEQSLPCAAELGHLVKDEDDGLLHAPIGILLQCVAGLHKANRGRDDQLTASGLLASGGQ